MCLRAKIGFVFIGMAALCRAMPAQVTEKPFTNTDVANMLKAGLGERTIAFAIQVASERQHRI